MNEPTTQNKGKKKIPASAKGGLIAGIAILLAFSLTAGCLIPFQNCASGCIAGIACLMIPCAINKSPQKNTYLQALRWSITVFLAIGGWVAFHAGGQYIINAIVCLVAAIMLAVIPRLKGR